MTQPGESAVPAEQTPRGLTGKRAWIYPIVAWTITLTLGGILWQSFFHPYPVTISADRLESATLVSSIEMNMGRVNPVEVVARRSNGEVVQIHADGTGDFSGKAPGDTIEIYRADGVWESVRYDSWTRRGWLIPLVGVLGWGTVSMTWNLPIIRRLCGRASPPD